MAKGNHRDKERARQKEAERIAARQSRMSKLRFRKSRKELMIIAVVMFGSLALLATLLAGIFAG